MSDNIQLGICPQVTKCTFLTQGANCSTPRNQYCRLSQSRYRSFLLSVFCICSDVCAARFRCLFHAGSFPSTQVITKSISDFSSCFFISHHKKFFPDLNSHCIANRTFIFPVIGSSTPTLMLYFSPASFRSSSVSNKVAV